MAGRAELVDTAVGQLHVQIDGEGGPAVLWHSLFVDSTTWDRMRPMLRKRRQLIIIDGPGHGQSGFPSKDFTLSDCAIAAAQVLDFLGVNQSVDWLGNAWGGHVGLFLAAQSPQRCRSLTTIASPIQALTRRERMTIVPMVWAYRGLGAAPPLARAVTKSLLGTTFIRTHPEETDLVVRSFRDVPKAGMHRAMVSVMLNRPDLGPLLPRINVPTVMIAATGDPVVPVGQIRAAVAQMPSAVAVIIDGEGHVAPIIAQADELAEVVTTFWNDPDAYVTAGTCTPS
jgi:pimeloyl-ACP methyl ester carboxylesterase